MSLPDRTDGVACPHAAGELGALGPKGNWATTELMLRIYDKHGPQFRAWVEAARLNENHGAGGPPPGWEPHGLHKNIAGKIGLWIEDGYPKVTFIPARFLVGVDLGRL